MIFGAMLGVFLVTFCEGFHVCGFGTSTVFFHVLVLISALYFSTVATSAAIAFLNV